MPKLFHCELPVEDAGERHSEASKCQWLAESLRHNRTRESRRVKIEPVLSGPDCTAGGYLAVVHCRDYISAVRRNGSRELVPAVPSRLFQEATGSVWSLYMAAMVVQAAKSEGSTSRIVGSLGGGVHHARRASGDGGMPFNALAVVAHLMLTDDAVRATPPASSVLIIDADGDCGGGTAELIAGNPRIRQVDVSVDGYDSYVNTNNASLHLVASASEYLATLGHALDAVEIGGDAKPLCLYSAGVNGHEDAEGGLPGITDDVLKERDRLVFDWCRRAGVRVAYTLGSGSLSGTMTRDRLVSLHRNTVEVAAVAASSEAGG